MKYSQLEEIVKELLEMIKSLDARLRIMENRNFLLTLQNIIHFTINILF